MPKFCPTCGKPLQFENAEICPNCGVRITALLQPVKMGDTIYTTGVKREYAGFWPRFGAYLLDIVIIFLIFFGFLIGFWLISPRLYYEILIIPIINNIESAQYPSFMLLPNWIFWIIGWAYFTVQESSSFQATLGKRAIKIKVVDNTGNNISFGQAVIRNLLKVIPFVSFICCIVIGFTDKKQGLHDMIAQTLVVYK